jgi:hypothetical protein
MTAREFCYWLQGYFEIDGRIWHKIDEEQCETIRKHLAMVFAHDIDPAAGDAAVQAKLNHIHNSGSTPRC